MPHINDGPIDIREQEQLLAREFGLRLLVTC